MVNWQNRQIEISSRGDYNLFGGSTAAAPAPIQTDIMCIQVADQNQKCDIHYLHI